jgi:hypothetical protein
MSDDEEKKGHAIPPWVMVLVPIVIAGVPSASAVWNTVESMARLSDELGRIEVKTQLFETRLRLSEATLAQLDGLVTPQGIAEYTASMRLILYRLDQLEAKNR